MKRFFSWVFLVVANVLMLVITGGAANLMVKIFDEFMALSTLHRVLVLFLGLGEIVIGVFVAAGFVSAIVTNVCDTISVSEKGLRYRVAGITGAIFCGVTFCACLICFVVKIPGQLDSALQCVMLGTYSIALNIYGKESKDAYENKKAVEEQRRIEQLVELKLRERNQNTID